MIAMYLISLDLLYKGCGLLLAAVAVAVWRDRTRRQRWGSCVFWALLAILFLVGDRMPAIAVGYAVVALVVLAATGQVTAPSVAASGSASAHADPLAFRAREAARLGNRLFWPALLVPAIALAGSRWIGVIHVGQVGLADPKQATLAALGLAAVVSLLVGLRVVGARPLTPVREGARLVELLGWSLILPQMLAALGGILQHCGVGTVVAGLAARALPADSAFAAVAVYCVAMAGFTVCMGNAFAAFAVITGGIGLPLIVHAHHGNPAIMAALGMLSGYCGTLVTPMAANFNIVPALLLELPDRNAVIKAQAPIAAVLLLVNIAVMSACVYRF